MCFGLALDRCQVVQRTGALQQRICNRGIAAICGELGRCEQELLGLSRLGDLIEHGDCIEWATHPVEAANTEGGDVVARRAGLNERLDETEMCCCRVRHLAGQCNHLRLRAGAECLDDFDVSKKISNGSRLAARVVDRVAGPPLRECRSQRPVRLGLRLSQLEEQRGNVRRAPGGKRVPVEAGHRHVTVSNLKACGLEQRGHGWHRRVGEGRSIDCDGFEQCRRVGCAFQPHGHGDPRRDRELGVARVVEGCLESGLCSSDLASGRCCWTIGEAPMRRTVAQRHRYPTRSERLGHGVREYKRVVDVVEALDFE